MTMPPDMDTRTHLPPEYRALPATAADRRWMDLMADELRPWSKHRGTKHVSVITGPGGEFRSLGYNGLPRGVEDGNPAFNEHPLKRQMTMCAERNALRNLRAIGGSPVGCTLHADAVPCAACAAEIAAAGIATVVMVDAEVVSAAHGDRFWRDGLSILLDAGIEIRQHDPATERYKAVLEKHYHAPIPSGTVDWDSRYLNLAAYLSRPLLEGGSAGTGEVIAQRPAWAGQVSDKTVRALGVYPAIRPENPGPVGHDATGAAALSGTEVGGCTLYLADSRPLRDTERLLRAGIGQVVLPDGYRQMAGSAKLRANLSRAAIDLDFHLASPQDYATLAGPQGSLDSVLGPAPGRREPPANNDV